MDNERALHDEREEDESREYEHLGFEVHTQRIARPVRYKLIPRGDNSAPRRELTSASRDGRGLPQ